MSHPPDHIPELDSPRQSRSPLKKGKKEQVIQIERHSGNYFIIYFCFCFHEQYSSIDFG